MSNQPQLYRIDTESRSAEKVEEVNFNELGLKERYDIQEWVAANPAILGEDLLIVNKEFSGFDRTNERLDLLAVDPDGMLVIIEMKRDDTGADAHWQAIKYASYLRRATKEHIVGMRANYANVAEDQARSQLVEHTGSDDLGTLNSDQRIILASHRFAPEVTSASLWLNEKAPESKLITCVALTPHKDSNTGALYIQATTIIPVPGSERYEINIGPNSGNFEAGSRTSLGEKLSATFQRNMNDEVTQFLRDVSQRTLAGLQDVLKPDKTSRWAGDAYQFRYYHFWYSRPPWGNWRVDYRINLLKRDSESLWNANVEFCHTLKGLKDKLSLLVLDPNQKLEATGGSISVGIGDGALDDDFANRIAAMTRKFIEQITPLVDDLDNESDEEEERVMVGNSGSPGS